MTSTPHTQVDGIKFINITNNNSALKSYSYMYNTIFPQTLSGDTEVLLVFYYTADENLPSKGIYKSNYFLTCELKTF